MRALVVPGALVAALIVGLSSCVYVPVEPVPPYGYVAPVPVGVRSVSGVHFRC
jgi:hypothetical protein